MSPGDKPADKVDWRDKKREYEERMARVKNAKLRTLCSICSAKAKLPCPCGTAQYCTVACQRIDWRERGHRMACKKIRGERAAEAARAEAPPPPSPVFYGPAPRSHADEVRARIAAEHEAARARREANPERKPESARFGSRCPICLDEWDVNKYHYLQWCCCRTVCESCNARTREKACPLCNAPWPKNHAENLTRLRRHVDNDIPEAMWQLAQLYDFGHQRYGIVKNEKKTAKILKRAVELGHVESMCYLGYAYNHGKGVKLDKKKAMQLFSTASKAGNPRATCNLAYLHGDDGRFEESFRLFKLSAEQNFTNAHFMVGRCYHTGQGVEVDVDEARRWYAGAAANGHEGAKEQLALIDRR